MADVLLAGIYRHYKGPLYLVVGLAHDANADALYAPPTAMGGGESDEPGLVLGEREVVVYIPLQLDGAHEGARLAVRTRDDFFAKVCTEPECDSYGEDTDETHCPRCESGVHPRFRYIGPRFTESMLT